MLVILNVGLDHSNYIAEYESKRLIVLEKASYFSPTMLVKQNPLPNFLFQVGRERIF